MSPEPRGTRIVPATRGRQETQPDPDFEIGLSESLKSSYSASGLVELYARFALGDGPLDSMMRRCIWRAVARRCGHGLQVGSGVGFKHLETFEIGDDFADRRRFIVAGHEHGDRGALTAHAKALRLKAHHISGSPAFVAMVVHCDDSRTRPYSANAACARSASQRAKMP